MAYRMELVSLDRLHGGFQGLEAIAVGRAEDRDRGMVGTVEEQQRARIESG